MRLIFSIPLLIAILAAKPIFAEQILTYEGRWTAGGSVSFPFEYNKYRIAIFGFSLNPEAGYFVIDDLELSGGATLSNVFDFGPTADARMQRPNSLFWGGHLGFQYYFPIDSNFRPYLGANFGFVMNKWEYKQIVWFLQIPVGVSWFINPNTAIQFGIPISVDFSSISMFEKVTINPGYLGVRAFF